MDLVLDIGNSYTKIALFKGDKMQEMERIKSISKKTIKHFLTKHAPEGQIESSIISTVRDYPKEIDMYLQENSKLVVLSHETPIPIQNTYQTPQTLGKDRLAAAIAAAKIFPHTNVLIIDAGTSMTFDLQAASGNYFGGAISPGIQMRFDALHHFTGKLPQLDKKEKVCLIGKNTNDSIYSGVLNGILGEVRSIIEDYKKMFPELKIIFTGGDYKYFVDNLNFSTFAEPYLVLIGLQSVLQFNKH